MSLMERQQPCKVLIVDIDDALASEQSYKPTCSTEKITDIFDQQVKRGWRGPKLACLFLNTLRQDPENLKVSTDKQCNLGAEVFENIQHTGALTWRG